MSIIFILFITRHIIPNFIFTNTIPTFPAEITVFSKRAPVFKLSYTRRICPWYILFHIQDGKGSIYTRLRYPNQNTYKSNYFHTGTYVYIFILRKYNVSYKCNTIYKVQTTMPYIVWPIFTPPPPFFHVYFISCIRSTMCTLHAMLFTHFICYFIQTPPGIATIYTVYNRIHRNTLICYLIFTNAILSIPAEVTILYIRTPIWKLLLTRMPGCWYFMCENVDCVPQQKSYKNL
ncbi:p110_14L [African swine fever virus]|uniref:p110_14L n=1 Tax=African swine fever virus TaxID=10497 RepID=A0A8A1UEW9_ASF|nr:p110_14L [African swine fever virus]